MKDRMRIEMRPRCRVGCYDWEKNWPRVLELSLEIPTDARTPGRSDQLEDGFNYEPFAARILEFSEGQVFQLVEALSEGVARLAVVEFGLPWVKVELTKKESLPAVAGVTIAIERTRDDFPEENP